MASWTMLSDPLGVGRVASTIELDGHPAPAGPPSLRLAWGELTSGRQMLRLAAAGRRLARAPRADPPGSTVIDVPGWAAPETFTAPLRRYLRTLGYDARGWGFGRNRGDVRGDIRRLERHLVGHVDPVRPVSLVGWSLGGVVVREVARRRPDLVRSLVTFGTPLGGTMHTVGARVRSRDLPATDRLARLSLHGDRRAPLQLPVTVVLSRRDGVVSWQSCLDHHSPLAEHVEVGSSHIGMVLDPDVWLTIARGLARR